MEENLEQPQVTDGSNEKFGKFKDAESLLKAYTNLEAEFTKKSQKLKSLESEKQNYIDQLSKQKELDQKVDDFVTKFEIAKPFSSALKESLVINPELNLGEEVIKHLSNNYKSAQDYAGDEEFLNNYIYSNPAIKEKIVKEYLNKLTQNSPIKVESGKISLTPPKLPTNFKEAREIAKSIIKQK